MKYSHIDVNRKDQVMAIIKSELEPYFTRQSELYKRKAQNTLVYYLNKSNTDFERILNASLRPFENPTPARKLFIWIWEVFFPGQDFTGMDTSSFEVNEDINEPLNLSQ